MYSKFQNDFNNEKILNSLMIKSGLNEKLKQYGYNYKRKATSKIEQDLGIDYICEYQGNLVNIDIKTRFTIPLYTNKINYTFALELLNCNSGKLGWFLDKRKQTNFYMLTYPILLKNPRSKRNYSIDKNCNILKEKDNRITGVMIQLVSVKKIREYIGTQVDKNKLIDFLNVYKKSKPYGRGIMYFDINFNEINKNEKGLIYITYNSYLREKPINLIINQKIYKEIREFEIELMF